MTFVTVYRFKALNPESGKLEVSPRLGTRAAIEKLEGKIIHDSAVEVSWRELDEDGFVDPKIAE